MATRLLGIEIGGTKLQIVVGDEQARIIARRRQTVDRARGGEGIREQIEAILTELLKSGEVPRAIGVGFGGPTDWRTGDICRSHHIEGWSGFPLGKWLSELTGAPAVVDNDANVAALGEAKHGAGKGANPVFYITLGSGVGGGLVVDGRIYHGTRPGEMEFGHIRLDRAGTIVESRCSGWSVDARIRALQTTEPKSLLARLLKPTPGGEARQLLAAVNAGDAAARKIMEELMEDVGFALAHATQLLHPEVIILGGGLSLIGEPLRVGVERNLRRWIMEVFQPGPQVCLAGLGEDVVPMGAMELARRGTNF